MLLSQVFDFAGCHMLTNLSLLTYALGRGVEYYDAPSVRAIARDAAVNDYRLSALILDVIKSRPFRMRRAE